MQTMASIIRKFSGILFRTGSLTAFSLILLPLLYGLELFLRIRIGLMHTQRIGHLAANTDMFFRKLRMNGKPERTRFFLVGWDPANRQLFDMFLRVKAKGVTLLESRWWTRLVFSWRPVLMHTRFWLPNRIKGTEFREYADITPVIAFTEEEECRGRAALAKMGISESDWFFCFHARDGSYLRAWRPQYRDFIDQSGTDRLNSDINNYLKAAEYITSRGGFALRMGAVVEAPLPETGNPKIIDYATRFRSDFMDIYLSAKCRFFLGTCSGLAMVPVIFGTPVIYANHMAFNHAPPRRSDLMIPRLLRTPDGNKIVNFQEAMDARYHPWSEEDEVTHNGVNIDRFDLVENAEDDILGVCQDMFDILDGKELSEEEKRLQSEHADRYFSHMPDYQLGGSIGSRFALKHKHLIDPDEFPRHAGERPKINS